MLIVRLSLVLAAFGQGIEHQLPLLGTLELEGYRLLQPLQQCFDPLFIVQANQAKLQWLQPFLQAPFPLFLSDASFAANIVIGIPKAQNDFRRVRQAAEQARVAALI